MIKPMLSWKLTSCFIQLIFTSVPVEFSPETAGIVAKNLGFLPYTPSLNVNKYPQWYCQNMNLVLIGIVRDFIFHDESNEKYWTDKYGPIIQWHLDSMKPDYLCLKVRQCWSFSLKGHGLAPSTLCRKKIEKRRFQSENAWNVCRSHYARGIF